MKKQENKAVSGILNQQQRTEQDNRKKVPFSVIIFPGSNGLFCFFSPSFLNIILFIISIIVGITADITKIVIIGQIFILYILPITIKIIIDIKVKLSVRLLKILSNILYFDIKFKGFFFIFPSLFLILCFNQ